jgi:hypothetical protein
MTPEESWIDGYKQGHKQKNIELLIELQNNLKKHIEECMAIIDKYSEEDKK